MSDQNQSDQNQNPVNPPPGVGSPPSDQSSAPPVFSPTADLPPIPPAFQSVPPDDSGTPAVVPTTDQPVDDSTGSTAPPDSPSIISSPKKKFGTGKIIATILGIFLLVGGVAGGVLLTQQNQNIAEKASGGAAWCPNGKKRTKDGCPGEFSSNANSPASNTAGTQPAGTYPVYANGASSGTVVGYRYIQAPGVIEGAIKRAASGNTADAALLQTTTYGMTPQVIQDIAKSLTDPTDPHYGQTWVPSGVGCNDMPGRIPVANGGTWTPGSSEINCMDWHWTTCTNKGTGVNGVGCDVPKTATSTNPPGSTNPPTNPTGQCLNVKAYDASWALLSDADLSALHSGSVVNFCVASSATSGAFDKAQFMIGSVLEPETTMPRPSSTDFCQTYTISATDTSVNVKAKVHHATLGWFGEAI